MSCTVRPLYKHFFVLDWRVQTCYRQPLLLLLLLLLTFTDNEISTPTPQQPKKLMPWYVKQQVCRSLTTANVTVATVGQRQYKVQSLRVRVRTALAKSTT